MTIAWVPSFAGTPIATCDVHGYACLRVIDVHGSVVAVCTGPEVSETAGWSEKLTIASSQWYDSHENLSLLLDWLGDMASSGFRSVVERPWKWEDEYRCAVAAREHERATETTQPSKLGGGLVSVSHSIAKDGVDDTRAYCDECGWNFDGGCVVWVCPFCETSLETDEDVERKAHLGCAADVAHDEQIAHEAAAR